MRRPIVVKRPRTEIVYSTVPKIWPNSTVVCLASGPSLTQADVDRCRGVAKVIAIKDSIRMAAWAPVLYACDAKWWIAHPETKAYPGLKYGLEVPRDRPDVQILRNTGDTGLERQPDGIKNGRNSGYQAINVAVHLGASRVILLGYDMRPASDGQHHFFGAHSYSTAAPPYQLFIERFETLPEGLRRAGVTVVNATQGSALPYFPLVSLDEALEGVAA